MEFFYLEHQRLDLGLGNPNKTAVLIACLMLVANLLKLLPRKKAGWILFGCVFLGLGICLVHTYSRGGIVALIVGQLFYWKFRFPGKLELVSTTLFIGVLLTYSSLPSIKAVNRYTQGMSPGEEDRSITNRLRVWRDAPQMMIDAPGGWGIGKSGAAWSQWYQPLETKYTYRTLVNSHLTWLVELGWGARMAYIFAWVLVLAIGLQPQTKGFCSGIWAAFATGGIFSSVAETPILWLAPALSLIGLVIFSRPKLNRKLLLGTTIVSSLFLVAILVWPWMINRNREIQVNKTSDGVQVGEGQKFVLVQPDADVLGRHFGHTIRKQPKIDGWLITNQMPSEPLGNDQILILSGNISDSGTVQYSTIYLNPTKRVNFSSGQSTSNSIILGGLRKDPVARNIRYTLQNKSNNFSNSSLSIIPGRKTFLGDWVTLLKTKP